MLKTHSLNKMLEDALKYHQSGELKSARSIYEQILKYQDNSACHYLFGLLLNQQKEYQLAIVHLERCQFDNKNNPDWFNAMAICAQKLGRLQHAAALALSATALAPDNPAFMNRYAKILLDQDKFDEAKILLEKYLINTNVNHPPSYVTLALAYKFAKNTYQSVHMLLRAYRLFPDNNEIQFNILDGLITIGRYKLANFFFEKLIYSGFKPLEVRNQGALLLKEKGELAKATTSLELVQEEFPDNAFTRWNLALLYLASEKWEKGWKYYRAGKLIGMRKTLQTPIPYLNALTSDINHLLITPEQGLGDQIMFLRLLPLLQHNIKKISVICDSRLIDLMSSNFPNIIFFNNLDESKRYTYDYVISMGDIPSVIPDFVQALAQTNGSYLKTKATGITPANQKYIKIGFTWKGGTMERDKRKRKIPLKYFSDLLNRLDCNVSCFQFHIEPDEQAFLNTFQNIEIPASVKSNEISGIAKKLQELDLLITADNSVAHLAGALGVKTYCLLPYSADWRWGINRQQTIWYDTVTLIRQPSILNWKTAFSKLSKMLETEVFLA